MVEEPRPVGSPAVSLSRSPRVLAPSLAPLAFGGRPYLGSVVPGPASLPAMSTLCRPLKVLTIRQLTDLFLECWISRCPRVGNIPQLQVF